jgi:hypothetical protein
MHYEEGRLSYTTVLHSHLLCISCRSSGKSLSQSGAPVMSKKKKPLPKDGSNGIEDIPADEDAGLDEWTDKAGLTGEGVDSVIEHLQDIERTEIDPNELP